VTLLAKVESVFSIRGRGAVVAVIWLSDLRVKAGDPVQLRSADGQVRDTRINGIELIQKPGVECEAAFLLPGDIPSDAIAKGTEIWVAAGPSL
jgi:translation elongation factor EF-Tu-like GTPase